MAIFFGVLLRSLIDERVHLLAGCCGQFSGTTQLDLLAIFFGVFLRRLIGETVRLLAGSCGQWCVVCVCWHEV
jgi:hypothetical protein